METLEYKLRIIEADERELIFKEFTNETALDIGLKLIEKGRSLDKPITIDISKNCHEIFHYSFDGTSPDNDGWITRKNNIVNRFYKSSLYIGLKLKISNKTLEEKYLLSPNEYAPYGGAFPLTLENVGVIGTITVSGLAQEDDHNLVVDTIREYLLGH